MFAFTVDNLYLCCDNIDGNILKMVLIIILFIVYGHIAYEIISAWSD